MVRSGKKSLLIAAAAMLVWIATPATAEKVDILCAAQNQNVGTVTVTNDADFVYVSYDITVANAFIIETHAHVANSLEGIPQTSGGVKNPKIGNFDAQEEHTPGVTTFTHTLPNPGGDPLYVAAHAVVAFLDSDAGGAGEVVDQQDPIITVTPGPGASGDPASAIAFGDGWYSLGDGGALIAEYECPLAGGVGGEDPTFIPDVNIWEKSETVPPFETALISVSSDGVTWTDLGTAGNSVPFAQHLDPVNGDYRSVLSLGEITDARYLRVLDTSDPGDANGFDLEAIKSRQICTPVVVSDETAWGGACGGTGIRFNNGSQGGSWATYFIYNPTL